MPHTDALWVSLNSYHSPYQEEINLAASMDAPAEEQFRHRLRAAMGAPDAAWIAGPHMPTIPHQQAA